MTINPVLVSVRQYVPLFHAPPDIRAEGAQWPSIRKRTSCVPALEEIGRHQGITTADMLVALRRTLRPTGDDLILLDGRTDDRFSQKFRNLKSHNTLKRKGFATFAAGKFFITPKLRSCGFDCITVYFGPT